MSFAKKNEELKEAFVFSLFVLLGFGACKPFYNVEYKKPILVDSHTSRKVKKLHKKLALIPKKGFAIGHQDATAYGIGWKYADNPAIIKSDINEIAGDFPAVYGFDIAGIENEALMNIDSVPFQTMKTLIIDAYKRGGDITISWHADNPVSGGNSWDRTSAVADILDGGSQSAKYELWLDRVAIFIKSLRHKGKPIPIIFRPFHEMNGAWFWWGQPNCTASDYKKLWQKTVTVLRDKYELNNLLYTYSPNRLNPDDNYLQWYPGDEYVDILGIDIYDTKSTEVYVQSVVNDLKLIKEIAVEKNKLFAFTETGSEKLKTPKWFTEVLYPAIENTGISWILLWRNANVNHHYAPYKGHPSNDDFIKFKSLPKTLFISDTSHLKN